MIAAQARTTNPCNTAVTAPPPRGGVPSGDCIPLEGGVWKDTPTNHPPPRGWFRPLKEVCVKIVLKWSPGQLVTPQSRRRIRSIFANIRSEARRP